MENRFISKEKVASLALVKNGMAEEARKNYVVESEKKAIAKINTAIELASTNSLNKVLCVYGIRKDYIKDMELMANNIVNYLKHENYTDAEYQLFPSEEGWKILFTFSII